MVVTISPLKVLVYDIETAPGEAYVWSAKTRFVPHAMMKRQPFMIQWSAAWLHGGKVISDSATPPEVDLREDARIVEAIGEMIRDADLVLAHNGDNFDIPWVRGRTWANDLKPLGPVASIDTKKLAAKDFYLMHNNLDALLEMKLGRNKIKTDFSWWKDIIEKADAADWKGCQKALDRMERYCRKDTRDLRDLFKTMIPHVARLPRLVDADGGMVCPHCGSMDLQKRGVKRTNAYNYQRYQCNSCKRYPSVRTNDKLHRNDLRPQ